MYSLLGWTTRGRHHTLVSVCLTVWPLHRDFSLLFYEKWSGFFYVHRVWLSYTRDRWLKVSSERLGNEDKAPCQRALLPWRDLNSSTEPQHVNKWFIAIKTIYLLKLIWTLLYKKNIKSPTMDLLSCNVFQVWYYVVHFGSHVPLHFITNGFQWS